MLSVGKIFWLIIILVAVWYLFKIIEKRKGTEWGPERILAGF